MRVIGTYKTLELNCRPSEILGIDDDYVAFCIDEACAFILQKLKNGEEIIINEEKIQDNFSKPSDLYKKYL